MIDTDAAFRAYLAATVAVTNLVSTRIRDGYLPEGATADTREIRPCISFTVDPGSPGADAYVPTTDVDYIVRCWADTSVVARSVYMAVKDAMEAINNTVGASVLMFEGYEIKPGRNDETEYGDKFCEAVFRVAMRTA